MKPKVPEYGILTMTPTELADQLEALNNVALNGRGVECVRQIIAFLRMNRFDLARSCASNDQDKLRNYPAIDKLCTQQGLVWVCAFSGERIDWVKEAHSHNS